MRQLYATLRHRPASLAGVLVALTITATFVTWSFSLGEAAKSTALPVQRLAGAAVIVTGNPTIAATSGHGPSASTDTVRLTGYPRVPASLLARLTAVPGVQEAIADQPVPVALQLPDRRIVTGTSAGPLTGYGWQAAILTPFGLRAGHAPDEPGQIVLGAGVASATGLSLGDQLSLAGRPRALFTVAGIAAAPAGNPAGDRAVFFSARQAAVLYGHPGQAGLIGIMARPGTSPATLAARIRAVLAGQQSVVTGSNRGAAEDPSAVSDLSILSVLALTAGLINVCVSLFVAASTVALSVAERARTWALLRAVGATPGQVRRTVMAELAVLGALAGPLGYLLGILLASLTIRGFAAHQVVPASTRSWASPVEILPSAAAAIVIAEVSGFLAARRASRIRPAAALGEATVERRYPGPLRLLLGTAALVAGVVLAGRVLNRPAASQQASEAEEVLLAFLAAIAFLAPYLISPAERVLRRPLRVLGGTSGRLASAELRARSRRMGAAAVAIALPVAYLGFVTVINATSAHEAVTQSSQRLAAAAVVSAPGPGLDPSVLPAIRRQPGVSAAVGLTPTTVYLAGDGAAQGTMAQAVTPGPLTALLRLAVTSGTLQDFSPGDIALSQLAAGPANAGVGQAITAYLADGTPYRAKVTAIFSRSLGFADALIPSAAAEGGHLGTSALSQVLIGASAGTSPDALAGHIAPLSAGYPGLQAASQSVANAQYEMSASQDSYANNLLMFVIGLLVSVALVNTLVVATLQRRKELAVLRRVGATTRQLVATAAWQAAGLALIGVVLGIVAQIATVITVSETLPDSPAPYIPWQPVTVILGLVVLLTGLAILAPTIRMVMRREGT